MATRAGAVALSTLMLVAGSGCAARQPARSFADLPQRLKPGHTVFVVDDTGSETRGKVLEISASDLTLDVSGVRRSMSSGSIRQVQRYGDSLWNGLLIGVAAGIPGVLIADPRYEACRDEPQKLCATGQIAQRVLALTVMGALGAGIDALIRGRHQIYLAPGRPRRSARRIAMSPRIGLTAVAVFITLEVDGSTIAAGEPPSVRRRTTVRGSQ